MTELRTQKLVDVLSIPGNFAANPDAVASLNVINDPSALLIDPMVEEGAVEHIVDFLLSTIPAGILLQVVDALVQPVWQLEELAEVFDELAIDRVLTSVDTVAHTLLVAKNVEFNGGLRPTKAVLEFITQGIEYLKNPDDQIEDAF